MPVPAELRSYSSGWSPHPTLPGYAEGTSLRAPGPASARPCRRCSAGTLRGLLPGNELEARAPYRYVVACRRIYPMPGDIPVGPVRGRRRCNFNCHRMTRGRRPPAHDAAHLCLFAEPGFCFRSTGSLPQHLDQKGSVNSMISISLSRVVCLVYRTPELCLPPTPAQR
jgi:hypothetical protein